MSEHKWKTRTSARFLAASSFSFSLRITFNSLTAFFHLISASAFGIEKMNTHGPRDVDRRVIKIGITDWCRPPTRLLTRSHESTVGQHLARSIGVCFFYIHLLIIPFLFRAGEFLQYSQGHGDRNMDAAPKKKSMNKCDNAHENTSRKLPHMKWINQSFVNFASEGRWCCPERRCCNTYEANLLPIGGLPIGSSGRCTYVG